MFRLIATIAVFSATAIFVAGQSGCTRSGVDPQLRAKLLLAEEPEGVQSVLDVREILLGESDDDHHDHEHGDHADDEDPHGHVAHDHDGDGHPDHAAHEHAAEPIDVVIVGQIGGLANPWEETQPDFPFVSGRAQFFLADLGAVAEVKTHGHSDEPGEECVFCAAHAGDNSSMLALVRFAGKEGHVLPIDAQQLFEIKESDTIVVRGTARILESGMMILNATGLHIRQQRSAAAPPR